MDTRNINLDDDAFVLEGVDEDKLPDEQKALIKQMRDTWLRKSQERSTHTKGLEKQMLELQAQHKSATDDLTAWNEWYQNEGRYMTRQQQQQVMQDEGLENPNALQQELLQLRQAFQQAATQYNTLIQQQGQRMEMLEEALRLSNELTDLRIKHPDVDSLRVINTAKEKGIRNMEMAYKLSYDDELRKRDVDKAVTEARAEERAKVEAERQIVETIPSSLRYTPPAEPKTYADASAGLLASVRSGDKTMP